tara:strand:- start:6940 stop:7191 length:252 start_codon:yes stop_codon:yes gene_type:complete
MIARIITGLITALGMGYLVIITATSTVDWIVQLASVPAEWAGLMTLVSYILVYFFAGGLALAVTILTSILIAGFVGQAIDAWK